MLAALPVRALDCLKLATLILFRDILEIPLKRRYEIYRGGKLLGYVGFDDRYPCEPFEPAEAFAETEVLFKREYEASARAGEVNADNEPERFEKLMIEAESIMDEIVAPGIRFEALEAILCSFDCDQLHIFDGRVCWR